MIAEDRRSTSSEAMAWNARLQELPWPSILQTWQWGDLKSAFGWQAVRLDRPAGMAQVLFRPTPLGPLAYIPLGPAAASPDRLGELLTEVHKLCRSRRAFALKVEPNWADGPARTDLLQSLGFRPSFQTVQPRSTAMISVADTEDGVLSSMKAKTRYNIRLAQRRGVTVRPGRDEDLDTFADLIDETGRRDGFGVHPASYYQTAYRLFVPAGLAELLIAEHEGTPLAAIMVFAFAGVASYLYGASSDRQRQLMPNYALQWEAIRWASSRGCRIYDLWGIPDEVGQNPEPYLDGEVPDRGGLWGVWRFKRGFGVQVLRRAGAWDYVYNPLVYAGYRLVDRLRGSSRD